MSLHRMKVKPRRQQPRYRQSPVEGGREYASTGLLPELEDKIEQDCRRYEVGRSFVIASLVGKHYGVRKQEDFKEARKRRGAGNDMHAGEE